MKKLIFTLTLLALGLAACGAPQAAAPSPTSEPVSVDSQMPVPGLDVTEMVVEPADKLPAASFESQTYLDETVGFALDYPADWTVHETMAGDRGTQSVLLSAPEMVELAALPAGETRVAVTVQQWDPKNDLAAFVEMRKAAWDASGFVIVEEEPLTLELGLAAVRFTVQTPDGLTVEWLFAAIGDQYLALSGEGDLALARGILLRLRPVSAP